MPTKRVLVVGASSGVGYATSQQLSATHSVIGWSRRIVPGNKAVTDWSQASVDVTDHSSVKRATLQEDSPFWALVYCAAIARWGSTGGQDPDEWASVIATNLTGAYRVLDAHRRRWGHHPKRVVLIGSEAAGFGRADRSAYHASKAALASFAESFRLEAAPAGTLVTLISPGKIDTSLTAHDPTRTRMALAADDVAKVVVAILSTPAHVEIRTVEVARAGTRFGVPNGA